MGQLFSSYLLNKRQDIPIIFVYGSNHTTFQTIKKLPLSKYLLKGQPILCKGH